MFNFFIKTRKSNHVYPLMRDPQRNPKCYEMTDAERMAAIKRSDDLLQKRTAGQVPGYWGA